MMPLYGFLQGDTIGLLVLASDDDTAEDIARKLIAAAGVRVRAPAHPRVVFAGATIPLSLPIARTGMRALDRFDVRDEGVPS
jgi:hypothetical protein